MDRSQKAESVASLNAVFNEVGVVVVTRNLGLSVNEQPHRRRLLQVEFLCGFLVAGQPVVRFVLAKDSGNSTNE